MAKSDIDQKILRKLEAAGAAGLNTSALLGKSAGTRLRAALAALVERGAIANLGTERRPRWVAQVFFQPLELAYEAVLAKATPGRATTYLASELKKGCAGEVAAKGTEAIKMLVRERKLITLKRGQSVYYLHAASIEALVDFSGVDRENGGETALNVKASVGAPPDVNVAAVRSAYDELVRETRFSDVKISELAKRSRVPAKVLGPWLIEQSRAGIIAPTTGDWALADEEERAAAISIQGEPHLRVRFR